MAKGMRLIPGHLDRPAQEAALAAIREVIRAAPLFTPRMPKSGKPMSVRMTNCGPLGWVAGRARLSLSARPSRDRPELAADP